MYFDAFISAQKKKKISISTQKKTKECWSSNLLFIRDILIKKILSYYLTSQMEQRIIKQTSNKHLVINTMKEKR